MIHIDSTRVEDAYIEFKGDQFTITAEIGLIIENIIKKAPEKDRLLITAMIADVVKFAMERSGCFAGNETVNGGNA